MGNVVVKGSKAAAQAAVQAAVAANNLVQFAQGIACPVQAAPNGRLGLRKWQLEAALHNHFGGMPKVVIADGYKACDPVCHYMCSITEALGRDPLVDSQRVEANASGQVRASTWYFDRLGETGQRIGGFSAGPSKGASGQVAKAKAALADAVLAGDTAKIEELKAKVLEAQAKPTSKVAALEQQLQAQAAQIAQLMAMLAK